MGSPGSPPLPAWVTRHSPETLALPSREEEAEEGLCAGGLGSLNASYYLLNAEEILRDPAAFSACPLDLIRETESPRGRELTAVSRAPLPVAVHLDGA